MTKFSKFEPNRFALQGISAWITPFPMGTKVFIDGDESIKAIVIGHLFREHFHQCECEWFANGAVQSRFIEVWRLTDAEPNENEAHDQ